MVNLLSILTLFNRVRDKLLNYESNDIDVAIDCMTGYSFCADILSSSRKGGARISKIAANPEKSKHLETATCRIRIGNENIELDFVNLRAETYKVCALKLNMFR
jgi:tRNA nucleotidyltransferase (CCA-adding enzyme)